MAYCSRRDFLKTGLAAGALAEFQICRCKRQGAKRRIG